MPNRAPPTITLVPGVRVGCAAEEELGSGVTAFLFDYPSPTVVDVRGPASATYDTHSLGLEATFGRRDALFFAGGSVYGLDAARGVRAHLLGSGRGEGAFGSHFPLPRISGAALYDLPRRPGPIPEYLALGLAAAESAGRSPVPVGLFGAGRGARVGKYAPRRRPVPGGQSSAAVRLARGHALGVFVVFNSVGAIREPTTGRWLAGALDAKGRLEPPGAAIGSRGAPGTTLAAVVTDLPLERRILYAIAEHVHDGIARTVVPAHTATEGDLVFAVSTAPSTERTTSESRPGRFADDLGRRAERLVEVAAARLFAPRAN